MKKGKKILNTALAVVFFSSIATTAFALPALQLGPGSGDWSWDASTQTWVTLDNPFEVNAYANATTADGGNGDYAWEAAGSGDQYAYLVFAATPMSVEAEGDVFDITVSNSILYDSGYGTPPIEDPNSLAPHGIYDTYFEIYQFQFDGALGTIFNTQPGETGSGQGYTESFSVAINGLDSSVLGIHMDLFTVKGDGTWTLGGDDDNKLVQAFAPFSHDAQYDVPEPATMFLFGTGLVGLAGWRRRSKK